MPKLRRCVSLLLVMAGAGVPGCDAAPSNTAGALGAGAGAAAVKQAPAKSNQSVQPVDGSAKMGGVVEDRNGVAPAKAADGSAKMGGVVEDRNVIEAKVAQ
jgi:hypothetical protein